MTKNTEKTAGQISMDLMAKDIAGDANCVNEVVDIRNEVLKDYLKKVELCIQEGTDKFDNDFCVVVEAKKERLMPNVIRNFIFSRNSVPTPHYDQTVYRYNKQKAKIEFLWCIPDKHTCEWMKTCPLEVDESHRDLRQTVFDFYDGTLDRQTRKINGEPEEFYGN